MIFLGNQNSLRGRPKHTRKAPPSYSTLKNSYAPLQQTQSLADSAISRSRSPGDKTSRLPRSSRGSRARTATPNGGTDSDIDVLCNKVIPACAAIKPNDLFCSKQGERLGGLGRRFEDWWDSRNRPRDSLRPEGQVKATSFFVECGLIVTSGRRRSLCDDMQRPVCPFVFGNIS